MRSTFQKIEQRKRRLSLSPFCGWLSEAGLEQDALGFAPSMSYFVLGFRDILALAKRNNPRTDLDRAINLHCEEDREHWKWFLSDIQKLGYLNTTPEKILGRIWSDEEQMPRQMIYHITHLIQSESDSRVILAIIECLEAAFAVFIETLKPQLVKRDFYEKLSYFGQQHDLGEQSHAMGSWIEGTKDHVLGVPPEAALNQFARLDSPPEVEARAFRFIDSIFDHFELLFAHWNQVAKKALGDDGLGSCDRWLGPKPTQENRRNSSDANA